MGLPLIIRGVSAVIPLIRGAYWRYRGGKRALRMEKAISSRTKRESLKEKTRDEISKAPSGRKLTSKYLRKKNRWESADKELRKKFGEGGGLPY